MPLHWTANAQSDGVASYTVYRGGTKVQSAITDTSYTDTGLLPSTSYSYAVTAVDSAGNESPPSAPLSVTTASGGDTTAPTVPGGVTVTPVGSSELDVSWAASTDATGVAGYKVYKDGGPNPVGTVTSGLTYKDTGLAAGSTHTYTVSAYDAAGNQSAQSSPPASGTTSSGGGTQVTLTAQDDATISKLSTGTNYGHASTLTVDADGNMNDFLLNFAIPASCSNPTAASLTLTVAGGSNNDSAHGGDFYAAAASNWSESTVTASNAPPIVTGTKASLGAVALNTAYSLDVTYPVASRGVRRSIQHPSHDNQQRCRCLRLQGRQQRQLSRTEAVAHVRIRPTSRRLNVDSTCCQDSVVLSTAQ